MAEPNYARLLEIEGLLTNDKSPMYKKLREQMAPYEGHVAAGKLTKKQYEAIGAQKALDLVAEHLGGQIPRREDATEADYKQRAAQLMKDPQFKGTADEANATVRKGEQPYSRAYGVIDMLRSMLPEQSKQGTEQINLTEPGLPTQIKPTTPPASVKTNLTNPQTPEEKLTDAQLQMLYNIASGPAATAKDMAGSFYETENLPRPPTEPPDRRPEEQKLFDAYKDEFNRWALGEGHSVDMPLPPGYVRSSTGVPITSPDEQGATNKELREKAIRENMYRIMRGGK